METEIPTEVEILDGFIDLNEEGLKVFLKNNGLAMTLGDLSHVQGYFKNTEKRINKNFFVFFMINLPTFDLIIYKKCNVKK